MFDKHSMCGFDFLEDLKCQGIRFKAKFARSKHKRWKMLKSTGKHDWKKYLNR